MPSPFPGMDPYLEAHWGDIHHRIVNYACDAIQDQSRSFARTAACDPRASARC